MYERLISGIESGEYIFDQRKADNAIRFIEKYMRHNKGALAKKPLVLSLWQKAAISAIFGILNPADGLRQFHEVFMLVGRKCGKTLLAAAIIAYEAFVDGEFGSEIYCLAPKLEQSDLVYSAFEFSVNQSEGMKKITRWRGRKGDIYIESRNTTIKKVAFDEKT